MLAEPSNSFYILVKFSNVIVSWTTPRHFGKKRALYIPKTIHECEKWNGFGFGGLHGDCGYPCCCFFAPFVLRMSGLSGDAAIMSTTEYISGHPAEHQLGVPHCHSIGMSKYVCFVPTSPRRCAHELYILRPKNPEELNPDTLKLKTLDNLKAKVTAFDQNHKTVNALTLKTLQPSSIGRSVGKGVKRCCGPRQGVPVYQTSTKQGAPVETYCRYQLQRYGLSKINPLRDTWSRYQAILNQPTESN